MNLLEIVIVVLGILFVMIVLVKFTHMKLLAALVLAMIFMTFIALLLFPNVETNVSTYIITTATLFTCAVYIAVSIIRDTR